MIDDRGLWAEPESEEDSLKAEIKSIERQVMSRVAELWSQDTITAEEYTVVRTQLLHVEVTADLNGYTEISDRMAYVAEKVRGTIIESIGLLPENLN